MRNVFCPRYAGLLYKKESTSARPARIHKRKTDLTPTFSWPLARARLMKSPPTNCKRLSSGCSPNHLPSLIDKITLILQTGFRRCASRRSDRKNPVARLKPPAGTTGERLPLSIKDVEALVKAAESIPTAFSCSCSCSPRPSPRREALGLKAGAISGISCTSNEQSTMKNRTLPHRRNKQKRHIGEIPLVPLFVEKAQ